MSLEPIQIRSEVEFKKKATFNDKVSFKEIIESDVESETKLKAPEIEGTSLIKAPVIKSEGSVSLEKSFTTERTVSPGATSTTVSISVPNYYLVQGDIEISANLEDGASCSVIKKEIDYMKNSIKITLEFEAAANARKVYVSGTYEYTTQSLINYDSVTSSNGEFNKITLNESNYRNETNLADILQDINIRLNKMGFSEGDINSVGIIDVSGTWQKYGVILIINWAGKNYSSQSSSGLARFTIPEGWELNSYNVYLNEASYGNSVLYMWAKEDGNQIIIGVIADSEDKTNSSPITFPELNSIIRTKKGTFALKLKPSETI